MKCSQCGQDIFDGMLFCTACGARIQPAQATEEKKEYRIVLERQNKFYGMAQKLAVKVDGAEVCRLKNGETREIRLAKGMHQVVLSFLGVKSKQFQLDVSSDQHLTCYLSAAKGAMLNSLLFTPIVVEDRNGVRL